LTKESTGLKKSLLIESVPDLLKGNGGSSDYRKGVSPIPFV